MAPITAGMDGKRHVMTGQRLIHRPPFPPTKRDFPHAQRHGLHKASVWRQALDLGD